MYNPIIKYCLAVFGLIFFNISHSQTWETISAGDWDNASIWQCTGSGCSGGFPDLNNLNSGATVIVNNGSVTNPVIWDSNDLSNMDIPNGVTLIIDTAVLNVVGDANIKVLGGGTIEIEGAVLFIENGNLQVEENATIDFPNGACFDLANGSFQNNKGAISGVGFIRVLNGNIDHDTAGSWSGFVEWCVEDGNVDSIPGLPAENCPDRTIGEQDLCDLLRIILPIELTTFTGDFVDPKTVKLRWETASETNNEWFVIERKFDHELTFLEIDRVSGAGNSDQPLFYSYNDNNSTFDKVQYRIKQIDYNGDFSYPEVIYLQKNIENNDLSVISNGQDFIITIHTADNNFATKIEVFNLFGQQLEYVDLPDSNQQQFYQHYLNVSDFSRGIFLVNVTFKNGTL